MWPVRIKCEKIKLLTKGLPGSNFLYFEGPKVLMLCEVN